MKKSKLLRSLYIAPLLIFSCLSLISPSSAASPKPTLATCIDLTSHSQIAFGVNGVSCPTGKAPAIWHLGKTPTSVSTGTGYASIHLCTKKSGGIVAQFIRKTCLTSEMSTAYFRVISLPSTPIISSAVQVGTSTGLLTIANPGSSDSPVAYYVMTNATTGKTTKITRASPTKLQFIGLTQGAKFNITLTAVSLDGTRTTTFAVEGPNPSGGTSNSAGQSTSSFSLSSSTGTATAGTYFSGYGVSSTGTSIDHYSITPAIGNGLSFDTSTGILTGTPIAEATLQVYTITAYDSSGTSINSATYGLTIAPNPIGWVGPGGGVVFYYSVAPFAEIGSACASSCHYLEWAPNTWSGTTSDPQLAWSSDSTHASGAIDTAIGTGFMNTVKMLKANGSYLGDSSGAAFAVHSYSGTDGSTGQWFLPSKDELNAMWSYEFQLTSTPFLKDTSGFATASYWSSSEDTDPNLWIYAWQQGFGGVQGTSGTSAKSFNAGGSSNYFVRPIRAF